MTIVSHFNYLTSAEAEKPNGVWGWAKRLADALNRWKLFNLMDVPIADKKLFMIRVNAAGDDFEYAPEELGLAGQVLTGLANRVIRVKPTEDGYFIDKEVLHSLIGVSLAGDAGKFIRVNATEDGFVYRTVPFGYTVVSVLANHVETATEGEFLFRLFGTFTFTLPPAYLSKAKFNFKMMGAVGDVVTIAAAGTDTIDGPATYTMNAQFQYLTLMSDGGAFWQIQGS